MRIKSAIFLTSLFGVLLSFLTLTAQATDGIPVWTNSLNRGIYGSCYPQTVKADASGNVYVSGYSSTNAPNQYTTLKYSSAGTPLWTNFFKIGAGSAASAMAIDAGGNVYVTGNSPAGTNAVGLVTVDFATIKYSTAGIPLWTNFFNGPGNNNDKPAAIAVDGSGNVYVTGFADKGDFGDDYATIKYSSAGVPLWTNLYDGPAGGSDYAQALAVDGSGNVYVTGQARSDQAGGYDNYATIKYSTTGIPLWTNLFNGPGNGPDSAYALTLDGQGNVYVTGTSFTGNGTADTSDYATIKYSSAGVPIWTNLFNGPANGNDTPTALAVNGNGELYVTGTSQGTNGTPNSQSNIGMMDYATIKYSSAGAPLWTNYYNGPQNQGDGGSSVAADPGGNVYVTGWTGDAYKVGTNFKWVTLKYSSIGATLWTNIIAGGGAAVTVDSGGNAYVTGQSGGSFVTFKFAAALAPSIVTAPANQTVTGSGGTFTVTPSGTPPFSYQWQLNGTNIDGANGSSYHLSNPTAADVGLYTVQICNASGCVTSTPATLGLMSLDIHPVLNLQAPIGTAYRIDYSEDLGAPTNWYILTNLTLPTSPYLFVDPTPSHQSQRFYRALQQ